MSNDIWSTTQPAGLEPPARSPLLDAKVMMVDDEPLMTELIQACLEEEGYANFVVTNDSRQAMDLLRREDPGLLLLDLMMPHVSGFELLAAIRADRKLRYTPVIVLTAATGADAKLNALQLGATDFLAKPVDASELALRVRNSLAFRQYHNRMLNYDQVTGLPNQRLFDQSISELVAQRRTVGGMVVIFSIAVPECRQLRETIDQATADELAKVLARRLDRFASNENLDSPFATSTERAPRVARLGAEHFGLVMEGVSDAEATEQLAKRVLAIVGEPVKLGLHEVGPSAWIGISVSPTDGDSVEMLRKGADLAATHARSQNTAAFKFASADLHARSYERMALGSQLRNAAQRGELRLHYQPKVNLASNRVIGAEALVRWQHPDLGLVPPARFIALAEELGLISSIGEWVIQRACQDAVVWGADGQGELTVAVNVSKAQFTTGNLCAVLRQAMQASGLPAHQLVIELTESMLMDDASAGLGLMRQLKDIGVTLSIDDFGTGYSSLSYLKRFPIDELKIDRSFVMDLPGGDTDVAIVRTVIDLGHRLGMTVTAEGVETRAQRQCLQREGCDNYQGFLYGKAVPAEQFERVLALCRTGAGGIDDKG